MKLTSQKKPLTKNIYTKILMAAISVIMIATPVARGTVGIWANTIIIPVSIIVFLWLLKLTNHDNKFETTLIDKPIFFFACLAIISFFFSVYKHASFFALLRLFSYFGIYYLIVNDFNGKMKRSLIFLSIAIGACLSTFGLLQYIGVLPHNWWQPKYFIAATYVNHNHFAGYLELVIPVAIGSYIRYQFVKSQAKSLLVLAITIMASAFIFAQSRGAWISLSISLLVMSLILLSRKITDKKNMIIMTLIIVSVFSFICIKSTSVSTRVETIVDMTKGEASPEVRIKIWSGTIDMIKTNPFIGTGIGTYKWGITRYRPVGLNMKPQFAHNEYLHIASEMGILAVPFMLMIFIFTIYKGIRSHSTIKLGCAIGVLSLTIHALVDFNFHIPANMILCTVLTAIVMSKNNGAKNAT